MSQDKNGKPQDKKLRDSRLMTQDSELARQVAELTEALQRERADSANIRRRHEEQMAGLRELVKANVVRELLPVIDNFERALKHNPVDSKQPIADSKFGDWLKGVMGIKAQFDKTLTNIGVERVKTVGEVFDPRYHEAVSMDEAGDGTKEIVSEELQAGYKLGNDVLRPAMVRVKRQ